MGYRIKKKEKNKGFYMDKKLFSIDDISFIETSILDAEGRDMMEKVEIAKRVTDILVKTYKRF
jgi:hypothetical protein